MQKKPNRKQNEKDKDLFHQPIGFGDIITMDNANILKPKQASRHGGKIVCIILDRYTGWLGAYPSPDRTTSSIVASLQHFIGRKETCNLLYFDNADEYLAAAKQMQITYDTRDANRPASNGVAERAVRSLLEGARSVLFESGLQHCYWAEAADYFSFTKNITVPVRDTKKTPYELRHGKKCKGTHIPFGALVRYLPTSNEEVGLRGKFDRRTRHVSSSDAKFSQVAAGLACTRSWMSRPTRMALTEIRCPSTSRRKYIWRMTP